MVYHLGIEIQSSVQDSGIDLVPHILHHFHTQVYKQLYAHQ
jgi:hypothetical protein